MDAGTALHNVATVTTIQTTAPSDDARSTMSKQLLLPFAKDVAELSATAAGETLHYTITVHNTGNIDLSSVALSEIGRAAGRARAPARAGDAVVQGEPGVGKE